MTYFFALWRIFYIMTYFQYFMASWRTYWYFTYLLTSWRTFWCYYLLSNPMTYFLKWRRNSWRHHIRFDVMTYFLMSWHTFWFYDVLYLMFDIMTYFWRHDTNLTIWNTFGRHDVLFDLMTYFLYILMFLRHGYFPWFLRHDIFHDMIVTLWLTLLDVMTYFMALWRTFWRYDILFIRSWRTWYYDVLYAFFTMTTFKIPRSHLHKYLFNCHATLESHWSCVSPVGGGGCMGCIPTRPFWNVQNGRVAVV